MGRLPIEACNATTVMMSGRKVLAFGGCNYLGLGYHPVVIGAIAQGLGKYGVSTTASRETTGNTNTHEALERELAEFVGQQGAILTAEGYTANFAACEALVPECGVVLIDQRAHRSIRNAARGAGMQVFEFEHLNPDSAKWLAKQYADAGVAIMTDSVFAADGAVAPLRELLAVLPATRSALLVDDCHGFCVLGPSGRGAVAHFGIDDPRVCITTTLAKGLGCYGGAVLGREGFIRRVRESAAVYRSSTPVPPAIAEGCRAAVRLLRDDVSMVESLRRNIALMRDVFDEAELPKPPEGVPIFTFTLDSVERMQRVHDQLLAAEILAPLIDYPGGPSPRYFRVVVNAMHSAKDIERLGRELSKSLANERQAAT